MKKITALLLCCLLLAGSLTGLAGGTVQPCASCGCDGPFHTEYVEKSFGRWTLHYKKDICTYCGDETSTLLSREDDNHSAKAKRDPPSRVGSWAAPAAERSLPIRFRPRNTGAQTRAG